MRGRRIVVGALVGVLALACGGEAPEETADAPGAEAEPSRDFALPPSAGAPRASQPGRVPDTVRPTPDSAAGETGEFAVREGRRRAPEEFDLGAMVASYRRYYREELVEMGSEVRGNVDPEIARDARRRVALEWGYVDIGAWGDLLADLTADQRAVLDNRLAAANESLAAELHAPGSPEPPQR